jgi:hypothetical protein
VPRRAPAEPARVRATSEHRPRLGTRQTHKLILAEGGHAPPCALRRLCRVRPSTLGPARDIVRVHAHAGRVIRRARHLAGVVFNFDLWIVNWFTPPPSMTIARTTRRIVPSAGES